MVPYLSNRVPPSFRKNWEEVWLNAELELLLIEFEVREIFKMILIISGEAWFCYNVTSLSAGR